jgi:hypothetical protein
VPPVDPSTVRIPRTWLKEYLATHYHRSSDDYATVVVDLAGALQYAE